jgi:transmembrane sensor
MNPKEEKINELLLDNRFVDWIVNPQSPYAEYWLQWIGASTENAALVEEARGLLLELRLAEITRETEVDEGNIEQMWVQIEEEMNQDASVILKSHPHTRKWYWMAAAVLVGLILFSAIALYQHTGRQSLAATEKAKERTFPTELVRYNGSNTNKLVYLPDGSKVTLAKGARISYDRLMNGKKRNVTLTGEAFFDVAKNPEKPFYIHTQNMVIKVLGTSFRVSASANKESVIVKTGKVSVYLKDQDLEQSAPKILLPQQVCTYLSPEKELITSVYADLSKIEMETGGITDLNFEDASIDTVFKAMEVMYALPVHYTPEAFEDCFITVSLGSESLEEKLEVITKTIGASFSISDSGIYIEGKGCK